VLDVDLFPLTVSTAALVLCVVGPPPEDACTFTVGAIGKAFLTGFLFPTIFTPIHVILAERTWDLVIRENSFYIRHFLGPH